MSSSKVIIFEEYSNQSKHSLCNLIKRVHIHRIDPNPYIFVLFKLLKSKRNQEFKNILRFVCGKTLHGLFYEGDNIIWSRFEVLRNLLDNQQLNKEIWSQYFRGVKLCLPASPLASIQTV